MVDQSFRDWMTICAFEKGDDAIDVLKFELVSVGSSYYILTEKVVPSFTDGIRVQKITLSDVAVQRSTREALHSVVTRMTDDQFLLSASDKSHILTTLSMIFRTDYEHISMKFVLVSGKY